MKWIILPLAMFFVVISIAFFIYPSMKYSPETSVQYVEEQSDVAYDAFIEPKTITSFIAPSEHEEQNIFVLNQDFFDKFLTWNFEKENENIFLAEACFDKEFFLNATNCISTNKKQCWNTIKSNYNISFDLENNFKDLSIYPLKNLSTGISFSTIKFNENCISFNIYFEKFEIGKTMKFGFNSTLVGTAGGSSGTSYTYTEKLVRDSNDNLHLVYSDSGTDAHYWNSTNNGSSWTDGGDIMASGTLTSLGIVVNSTNSLFAFWIDTNSIYMGKKDSTSATWTTKLIYPGQSTATTQFQTVSAAIDSKDIIHLCLATTAFNASSSNDWLAYTNLTGDMVFWTDGSIQNTTHTWNGTWLNTNAADDSDECDIEVDKDDNVLIVERGSDAGRIGVFSSKKKWNRTIASSAVSGSSIPSLAISLTTNKTLVAFYGTVENKIRIINSTTDKWNLTWTTQNPIDNLQNNIRPSLKISEDERGFITYENGTTRHVFFANSSYNFTSWTNHTLLEFTSGWANIVWTSLRGSNYPSFNRVRNDFIEYIFWNDTDNGVYYGRKNITIEVAGPPLLSFCNWLGLGNLSCECQSNNGTTGLNAEFDLLNFTGSGTIHIDYSNITYSNLYVDDQCIIDTDVDTILAAKEGGG